jgi:tRNA pseudouridine38/39 synthase
MTAAKRIPREIDFRKYARRKIALKIAYFGWDFDGFAAQGNTKNTVEEKLFDALLTARLVSERPSSSSADGGILILFPD